jgi:hypothetical protein
MSMIFGYVCVRAQNTWCVRAQNTWVYLSIFLFFLSCALALSCLSICSSTLQL